MIVVSQVKRKRFSFAVQKCVQLKRQKNSQTLVYRTMRGVLLMPSKFLKRVVTLIKAVDQNAWLHLPSKFDENICFSSSVLFQTEQILTQRHRDATHQTMKKITKYYNNHDREQLYCHCSDTSIFVRWDNKVIWHAPESGANQFYILTSQQ